MTTRPLYEIARDIAVTWRTPSPHAKAYLKAMHYLVGINDSFAAGNARRIVRCFILYSKDWQGPDADRIKGELRDIGQQSEDAPAPTLSATTVSAGQAPPVCELCTLPIKDKFVHGHSVWGVNARMCPSCHYYIGVGFDKADGALYLLHDHGWRHLHGSIPAEPPPASQTGSPITGTIPMIARAKRGRIVKLLSPSLRRVLKAMWRWTSQIGARKAG